MAGGMYVRVEGNTDNLGDDTWNQGLSERRAQAIVDYLVSRGIDRRRMVARGNGSHQPARQQQDARRPRAQSPHRHPVHPGGSGDVTAA